MVQKRLKIINKSGKRDELLVVVAKVLDWNRDDLDIKKMDGSKNYYRCRIGKIRIIFFEENGQYYIDKVWYRGDIYKK